MNRLFISFVFCIASPMSFAGLALPFVDVEPDILEGEKELFIPHSGPGAYDNWVGLNVAHAPMLKLKALVEKQFGVQLQGRNESHITVVTPPEWNQMSSVLPIADLNARVEKTIQKARYHFVCVGRGSKLIDGKEEHTYFLVLRSPELVGLREGIQGAVEKLPGAKPGIFEAQEFFPHITIGYTKQDIHIDSGVVKDFRSCVANVRETR